MKQSRLYLVHALVTFSILIWGGGCGCGSSMPNLNGNFDAKDFGSPTNVIKTKVAGQPFQLAFTIDTASLDSNLVYSGSIGYDIYDSGTPATGVNYISTQDINYGTITRGSNPPMQATLSISKASKNLSVHIRTCITYDHKSGGTYYLNTSSNLSGCTKDCPPSGTTIGSSTLPCKKELFATDNFAVRPDHFTMIKASSGNLNSLTSADPLDLTFTAEDALGGATDHYTTNANLNIATIYYEDNDTIDTTANMAGTSTIVTQPSFTNGLATNAVTKFDNVGKISMHFEDRNWANVDSSDGTPQDCSANGGWICGDLNSTYNPASFTFDTIQIKHAHNGAYTYMANDLDKNMSLHMDISISARNADGNLVTNFTKNLWEMPITIDLTSATANVPTLVKQDINTATILEFNNGNKLISWNEIDTNKQLKFNFARDTATPLNPIRIAAGDITLTATVTYPTGDVTATATNTNAVNLLYARTHAPRQRFNTSNATDLIYVETYCYGTDTNGNSCDKTLLPNSITSKYTDDPRWFVNTLHTPIAGVIGTPSQIGASKTTIGTPTTTAGITQLPITYTGFRYPYKVTFENNASPWLLYDKYSSVASPATTNKFEVEFVNSASSWAGSGENSASTAASGASKTNRRTMW